MMSRYQAVIRLFEYARRYYRLLFGTVASSSLAFAVTFLFPWLIGSVLDRVVTAPGKSPRDRLHELLFLLVIGAVTAITSSLAMYGRGHLSVKLGNHIIKDVRQDTYDHLSQLSLHFYAKEKTGSIVSRLINDIQQASQIVSGGGVLLLLDIIQIMIGAILLTTVSWKISLAFLATLPMYALCFRWFNPDVKAASEGVARQISKMSGTVQERLAGIALVKASATEEHESARFKADNEEYYGRVVQQSNVSHLVGALSEVLIHSGTLIVIGLGGYFSIFGHPAMTAGQIVKILGWLGIMYGPVKHLADINIVYQTSMAALDRVFEVIAITPKIKERHHAVQTPPCRGEVVFDQVKFRYEDDSDESHTHLDGSSHSKDAIDPQRTRWILDGLGFHVRSGERVALVGPSGSGKSTLVSLLPRLYDVSDGSIQIDGVDVRDYQLNVLRRSIGIVQQQSLVFTGSIAENICYGCDKSDEPSISAAAKSANADEFIRELPDGYQTILGERGVNLSGGQLQRLSIARAILKDPRILILDEATSALDAESEAMVQEAFERVMKGRTCFIIAHRLSTIRNADRIIVLDRGKIAEEGRHDELISGRGLYARMACRQFERPAIIRPVAESVVAS